VVRTFLGFRECSMADAEKLTVWLAEEVPEMLPAAGLLRSL